jgi:hypothetical protein
MNRDSSWGGASGAGAAAQTLAKFAQQLIRKTAVVLIGRMFLSANRRPLRGNMR